MRMTIFNTPIVSPIVRFASHVLLKVLGWTGFGEKPNCEKYIIVAGPHTSNWDFFYTVMVLFVKGIAVYWVGKHTLFRGPMGPVSRWLGGIPIVRSERQNLVDQVVDMFNSQEEMVLLITPEGTRGKVRKWKTGFYHIARGANIPLMVASIDYKTKYAGLNYLMWPSDDVQADVDKIKALYASHEARYPQLGVADELVE